MSVNTTPHINFRGQAREALEFYRTVFGGQIMIATYSDIHQVEDPAQAGAVAFGVVEAPSGFQIMAYDVQTAKPFDHGQNAFYVVLRGTDREETQALWDGLSDGAQILTAIGPAVFSAFYGMLTDRFGVTWIIDGAGTPSN